MKNRFGWRGMPWVLDEVFKSIDTDGSGEIGFDERERAALAGTSTAQLERWPPCLRGAS